MTSTKSNSQKPFTRREVLLPLAGLPLFTMASLGAGCGTSDDRKPLPPVDNPFEGVADFNGAEVTLPELLGNITVVDFWASWCAPCRQAFPYLDQLHRGFAGDGLQVIGVCVDEEASEGRAFAARYRPQFSVVWDKTGNVRRRFLVDGLPTTLLIDAQGQLLTRYQGFELRNHRALENQVRQLVRRI